MHDALIECDVIPGRLMAVGAIALQIGQLLSSLALPRQAALILAPGRTIREAILGDLARLFHRIIVLGAI